MGEAVVKPHILVVEDNAGDIELLQVAIEDAGLDCTLTVFRNGADAIAFLARQDYSSGAGGELDIAIIDLNLPRTGGLEVVEKIRSNPKLADLPVIVFSSSSLPAERARLEALNITRHILKPSDLEELSQVGAAIKALLNLDS